MTGKPLNHRGTFYRVTNRTPKWKLSEILESLGINQIRLIGLISRHGGFPSPAIRIGASHTSGRPNSTKLYASKTYYDKKEVVDWYKKVTADE